MGFKEGTDSELQDDLKQTVPFYPLSPPSEPATTFWYNITLGLNETGFELVFINNSSFIANYKSVTYQYTSIYSRKQQPSSSPGKPGEYLLPRRPSMECV